MKTSWFALAAMLLLAASPARLAPATPDAIYERVRDAVDKMVLPPYIAFTLQDSSTLRYSLEQERLRMLVRVSDGRAFVVPIRTVDGSPARDGPRVVTGTIVPGTSVYRAGDFPLADFGLRRKASSRPGIFEAAGTPAPLPSADAAHTIASVNAVGVAYRIADLGDTSIGGRDAYHFSFTPLYDPGHHVLREMWIDEETLLPRRYVAERFVDAGVLTFRYLVTVNAKMVGGHLVNADADGHFNVNRALIVHYSGEGQWRVLDVSFPPALPDWLFDPQTYAQHKNDPLPAEARATDPSALSAPPLRE